MRAGAHIVHRYYLAMATPFLVDLATSAVYVAIHAEPLTLLPLTAVSATFLVAGVGLGASVLIRPVQRFIDGDGTFDNIEHRLTGLAGRSALLIGCLFAPMLAFRLLAPRLDITFGAAIEIANWIDTVCTFLVVTSFNVVLAYFVVSAYLDQLCEHLFRTRAVNIATFRGTFRRKVAIAMLFVSSAALILLTGDIVSYSGDRLLREAAVDIAGSVLGAIATYYWISLALTRPIVRLDRGLRQVSDGDLAVRLPVTSDDEIGRATNGFNRMVEGLAERRYLRDTFGKYVSESVAAAILGDHERGGRVADTLAEATLMFVDIEGFTALSETLPPAEIASVLNDYLGTIVPAIERHGGVVNNFIGDGLFASFNLPLTQANHASAALTAALEIQQALAGRTFTSGVRVRSRIGINTGPVIGVSIGTANRMSYTLLGDAVNVASRVEQLNKQFGSLILATESTVAAAGKGFACRRLGEIDVRGHRGDVVVYRVDATA